MKSVNHKDRLLIENLSDAYAYHQIVTDSEGSPVDDIFLEVNPAFEKMTGLKREDIIGKKVTEVLPGIKHSSFDWIDTVGRIVQTGETSHFELYFEPLRRYYKVTAYAENDSCFSVIFKDITERKEKKERTKELGFLQSFSLLLRKEGNDLEKILAETAKLLPSSFKYPQLACACITFEERQYKTKSYQTTPLKISSTLKAQDQQVGTIEVCYLEHPGQDLDPEPFLKDEKIMLDMVAENLGQVIERNRLGRDRSNIFEFSKDMIGYAGLDGNVIEINPACEKILGWNQEKFVGSSLWDNIHSEDMDATNKTMETLADGKPLEGFTNRLRCTDGSYRWISWSFYPELDLQRIFFAGRDITGAIKAEEELRNAHDRLEANVKERTADLEKALKQVQALRNIDMAITGSLDLRVTFKAILDEVTSLLNVDGAAILRLDPNTATLNYEAWRGFNTADPKSFNLHWGEEFAGRVAKDRETVHIADLNEKEKDQVQRPLMDQEGFRSYYAVPLIAKGYVLGVLEIFHRQPLNEGNEWLNFLETLAGQASIAIDSADLFSKMERSHKELLQAYDATIEGWAFALDLKDEETEEHSRRVTDITMKIARRMNFKNEELSHVKRGALLHDIGKMGVPDSILLKNGKLNDEEWAVMKKHPVYAYEMLSPIDYLRPALDIPYCHHEKWDGSGYPRGLKDKQIPTSARIFAVVDVYDALTSDRPYRKAWSEEDTLKLIREESGSHFDPEIVEIFLKELENTS